jgi:hypothetical protein
VTNIATAAVLTLHATPVTIVPAQGAGNLVVVDDITCKLVFNSIAYTGSNNVTFSYTNGSGAAVATPLAGGTFLDSSSGTNYDHVGGLATELTPVANAPVVIAVASANPAAGNSPLEVVTRWHIVQP